MIPHCFLSRFSSVPCDGRLVKAHLLPQQLLRREHPRNWRELVEDPRTWVPACGGPMGNAGHHGHLDCYQLVVPRECLPVGVEEIAVELGLGWWLDRRFGEGQVTELVPRTAPTFDELYPEGS